MTIISTDLTPLHYPTIPSWNLKDKNDSQGKKKNPHPDHIFFFRCDDDDDDDGDDPSCRWWQWCAACFDWYWFLWCHLLQFIVIFIRFTLFKSTKKERQTKTYEEDCYCLQHAPGAFRLGYLFRIVSSPRSIQPSQLWRGDERCNWQWGAICKDAFQKSVGTVAWAGHILEFIYD